MANYVVKGESLTAVADAIREKTGSTEPLGLVEMPEAIRNIQADDGGSYDQGFAAGKQAEYDAFWDVYQQNGYRTDYNFAFAGNGWTDETYNPKYPINIATVAISGFANARITSTKVPIIVNTSRVISNLFNWPSGLTEIPSLKITGIVPGFSGWFEGCGQLEILNITADSVIAASGLNVSACTKLTHGSLISILNALKDYSGSGSTYSVTLGEANLAKLTDAEKMQAVNKGWTLVGWTPPEELCSACGAPLDENGNCSEMNGPGCDGYEEPRYCSGCGEPLDENGNCSVMQGPICDGWVEE